MWLSLNSFWTVDSCGQKMRLLPTSVPWTWKPVSLTCCVIPLLTKVHFCLAGTMEGGLLDFVKAKFLLVFCVVGIRSTGVLIFQLFAVIGAFHQLRLCTSLTRKRDTWSIGLFWPEDLACTSCRRHCPQDYGLSEWLENTNPAQHEARCFRVTFFLINYF